MQNVKKKKKIKKTNDQKTIWPIMIWFKSQFSRDLVNNNNKKKQAIFTIQKCVVNHPSLLSSWLKLTEVTRGRCRAQTELIKLWHRGKWQDGWGQLHLELCSEIRRRTSRWLHLKKTSPSDVGTSHTEHLFCSMISITCWLLLFLIGILAVALLIMFQSLESCHFFLLL